MIIFSPTAKILLYILLVIVVFFLNSFGTNLGFLALVFILFLRVPVSNITRGIIPITLFLAFTFFSNVLFQKGRIIYEIWGVAVTEEGLRKGGHLTLRLFILILGAKILTASITAEDLVKAMTRLLGPAAKWKTVREFMFTMSLTLRFLPIIYDEAQLLFEATFKNSTETTFMNKIKLSASLLTLLFERSIKRARELQIKEESFEP